MTDQAATIEAPTSPEAYLALATVYATSLEQFSDLVETLDTEALMALIEAGDEQVSLAEQNLQSAIGAPMTASTDAPSKASEATIVLRGVLPIQERLLDEANRRDSGSQTPGAWAGFASWAVVLVLWTLGVAAVEGITAILGMELGPWMTLLLGLPAITIPLLVLRGIAELALRSMTSDRAVRRAHERDERLRELGIDIDGELAATPTGRPQEKMGCP